MYSNSSTNVIIEPQCIFCGGLTDNIEKYTITETEDHPHNSEYYTSNSLTIPFPAHHHCLQKKWLALNGGWNATMLIIVSFVGFSILSLVLARYLVNLIPLFLLDLLFMLV